MASHTVRSADPSDTPDIHRLVRALAHYERAPEAVQATADDLATALFGPDPQVFCHVADVDGKVVGFAVWYVTFSTWVGRHGIWVEDLFVLPEHRGQGLGRLLFAELARVCVSRGYGRMEWAVLQWNEPAIGFYRSLGAQALTEWSTQRLDGGELTKLAGQTAPPGSLGGVTGDGDGRT